MSSTAAQKAKAAAAKRKKKLTRKTTFIGQKDLVKNTLVLQSGSANIVGRVQVKADRGIGPDVFFKQYHKKYAPSQYAVASSRLADFIGMPDLIAHNAFAEVNKAQGVVSELAPGVQLRKGEYNAPKGRPDPGWNQAQIDDWVQMLQLVERNGQYFGLSGFTYQWVDLSKPEIQKGLADLQLFDAISGQSDRHVGNIFVDPDTGQVTGIDDDQSFGQGQKPDQMEESGDKYRGLPGVVDAGTAEQILLLKPRELRAYLQARKGDTVALTDKDLDDAEARLRVVQSYLRWLTEEDLLVHNWDEESYEAALENPDRSYLGHYAQTLAEALVDEPEGYVNHVVGAPPPPVVQPTVVQPTVQQTVWTAAPRGAPPSVPRIRIGQQIGVRPVPTGPTLTLTPVLTMPDGGVSSNGPGTPSTSSVATRASRAFSRTGTWTVGQGGPSSPGLVTTSSRLGPTEEE
jgi:hypothetical protein